MVISQGDIEQLERWIDKLDASLEPLQYFILPAGGASAAALHVCRTVCRRAERCLVDVQMHDALRGELVQYLNRLSDYFFVAARYAAKMAGEREHYWNPAQR